MRRRRRPSLPLVIALLALFVALGGPAEAQRFIDGKLLRKGSVTSRAVKDRSLKVRDLGKPARRALRATRNNSITEAKLANGSVTPGKLAPGAVGSAAIADRSVGAVDLAAGSVGAPQIVDGTIGGAEVADGSLAAQDLGRYYGRFRTTIGPVPAARCWSAAPAGLAPEQAGADISQDLVLVTPDADWPEDKLAFTVRNDGRDDRFVLAACNHHPTAPVPAFEAGFRYLVIDLP
ncbi:MAG: hypothetical protein ACRDPC_21735 [Solirubrobacteraceae bacterium]